MCDRHDLRRGSFASRRRHTVVELHRQRARLDAVITRATTAFDAERCYDVDGAKTTAAWLATTTRVPMAVAKREVRVGRALREMPLVEVAFLAGDITIDHVSLLASAQRCAEKAFERDEELLVEHAKTLRYKHFSNVMAYWRQCADPDGVEDDAESQRVARRLHLSQSLNGMWLGDMRFDPVSGTIVSNELTRIEAELYAEDWAEAKECLGEEPTLLDLKRTPAQRRADAMVEMAMRSRTAPANGRRPEPLFSVLVGYETFAGRICELANGTVVTPGSMVNWLDRVWVERVVFDGPSRVTDVGVQRRIFEGATRRALEVRDRECFHPFCEEPAERCQMDHIEPYGAGGLTTMDNGRPACAFHNRQRHRRTERPPP